MFMNCFIDFDTNLKTLIWFQVLKLNMAKGVCIKIKKKKNLAGVPVMGFQLYIHMYVYLNLLG